MNIVLIGARKIYPDPPGGIDSYTQRFSHYLIAQGYTVTVYCHKGQDTSCVSQGMTLKTVWTFKTHHLDTFLYSFLASIKVIYDNEDGIIHYHGASCLFAWLPRLFGKKVIVTTHSQEWRYSHIPWYNRLFYFLAEWIGCRSANRISTISHDFQQDLNKRYGKEVFRLSIGIEPEVSVGIKELSVLGLKSMEYILFLGRIAKGKGVELLLEAHSKLGTKETHPLVIAGKPLFGTQYLEDIKKMAGKNVLFTGAVYGDLKRELFANALLYVQASQAEGLSAALLEAMSYGCPVLVSDITQNIEAVSDAGYFFKNNDPDDLKSQMEKILANKEELKRMGEKGRLKVKEESSWEHSDPPIKELYNL